MKGFKRGASLAAAMLLTAALVSGCSTFGDDNSSSIAANDQPAQLPPVADSSVSSNSLPPLGGAGNGAVAGDTAPLSDDEMLSASNNKQPNNGQPAPLGGGIGGPAPAGAPAQAPGAAGGQGAFVSLNDVNQPPAAGARDLSGGLTVEKLLGGWTITSGSSQCRLNFTYTAAGTNDRYRASSPGCVIATLAQVTSWRLSGTQVQLFDGNNRLVGALLLSGNRFLGTLTGGQAITMAG